MIFNRCVSLTADLLTLCQKANQEAESNPLSGGYIPKCKSDGRYEEIQCLSSQRVCWCVDQAGNEIQRTLTASNDIRCPSSGSLACQLPLLSLLLLHELFWAIEIEVYQFKKNLLGMKLTLFSKNNFIKTNYRLLLTLQFGNCK